MENENETGKKKPAMKRTIISIAAVVIGVVIGNFVYAEVSDRLSPAGKALREIAKQVNTNLPMMLDTGLRVDSAKALKGKKFMYTYSTPDYTVDEVNLEFFDELKPLLTDEMRTSPDALIFRQNNVTMVYLFKDKKGKEIIKFELGPNDYK